eukprot:Gregarina_sp_Poly_1__10969@NODE_866_length_5920_cov_30_974372_g626_i0_p2_GENE_NODE_866_length_5920_cov_30_974372_g626_i0NODE_866_length_5920_cov_30_974372_g626_i0_p2_ORF_typecomplete_len466_score43_42_NODE_866_length_5920_cov_30_974372_g626_i05691966
MLNADNFPTREGQATRVCTGIILLVICMMLAHVQDGKQAAALERAASRARRVVEPSWIHSSIPCSPGVSRMAFFSTKGSSTFVSWQATMNTNSSNLASADSFTGQLDLETGQGVWFSLASEDKHGPINDSSIFTPSRKLGVLERSGITQVVPFYGLSCQSNTKMCVGAIQKLSNADCQQALWINQNQANTSLTEQRSSMYDCLYWQISGCHRFLLSDSLAHLGHIASLAEVPHHMKPGSFMSTPFCGNIQQSTLAFDPTFQELMFLSEIEVMTPDLAANESEATLRPVSCLWRIQLESSNPKIEPDCFPLQEIDETKMKQRVVDSRQKFGQSIRGGAIPGDIDAAKYVPNPGGMKNANGPSKPFLIFPSLVGNHISVLRSQGDTEKKLIVSVLDRIEQPEVSSPPFRLKTSVQFNNLDVGWILDVPSSEAQEYLLILGSAPPYAWQVEAIDLKTGFVHTRNSFTI